MGKVRDNEMFTIMILLKTIYYCIPFRNCGNPTVAEKKVENKSLFLINTFTLIEVILAVAIMMLVFLVAGTGLMAVQKTWIKSQAKNENLKKWIIIDKIVNANFSNIIPFQWRDDKLKKRNIFLGDPNKIIFATTHRINIMKQGAIRFISIYVRENRLMVAYSNTPILFWDEKATPVIEEAIAEDVSDVTFLYADVNRDRELLWEEDWDEDERRNIPMAIQMTVHWNDGTSTSWLKRTAGAGKYENFGKRYYDRPR